MNHPGHPYLTEGDHLMCERIRHSFLTGRSKEKHPSHFLFYLVLFVFIFTLSHSDSFAQRITSQAAVIMDASTGEILYGKNSDNLLAPASTTKLMTAIVVLEKANLPDIVTISPRASHVHPSRVGFKAGDRVTIEGLLYAALLKSGNDAAVALAEAVAGSEDRFVTLMNQKAVSIGAGNTKFINATGLPGRGQYITALDLSRIMRYAMGFPKLTEILATPAAEVSTEKGKAILLRNTDKLLWSDEEVIGGKTGYTCSAKHCFVFAAQRHRKTIIVSLLGSPSRRNLWKEARKLSDKGFQMMAQN